MQPVVPLLKIIVIGKVFADLPVFNGEHGADG